MRGARARKTAEERIDMHHTNMNARGVTRLTGQTHMQMQSGSSAEAIENAYIPILKKNY